MSTKPENKNRQHSIYNSCYVIADNSKEYLVGVGFKQRGNEGMYIYYFDALRHEKTTVLTGRIIVYDDAEDVHIEVLDDHGSPYAPFYNAGMYNIHRTILEKVNDAVLEEFKKLGIKRVDSERRR